MMFVFLFQKEKAYLPNVTTINLIKQLLFRSKPQFDLYEHQRWGWPLLGVSNNMQSLTSFSPHIQFLYFKYNDISPL